MRNVKRWLALSMVAAMTAGTLAGCGGSSSAAPAKSEAPASSAAEASAPAESEASAPAETSAEGGKVYYLNFKPEQADQ